MSNISNCGKGKQEREFVRFAYKCPKRWHNMQVTAEKTVRFCNACQENVFFCTDRQEAEQHALQGHCIAIARQLDSELYNRYTPNVMGRPDTKGKWGRDLFERAKHQPIEVQNSQSEAIEHEREGDRTNLSGADLSHTDLAFVDLSGFNLAHANLSHANLTGANLNNTNLAHADLSRANLSRANLSNTDFSHANLSGVSLTKNLEDLGDRLSSINLNGTILEPNEKVFYLTLCAENCGNRQKATNYLQQALTVQQTAGDRFGESLTLTDLGDINKKEPEQALEYYERALGLLQQLEPDKSNTIDIDSPKWHALFKAGQIHHAGKN